MGLLINLLDDISKQQYVEKGKNYLNCTKQGITSEQYRIPNNAKDSATYLWGNLLQTKPCDDMHTFIVTFIPQNCLNSVVRVRFSNHPCGPLSNWKKYETIGEPNKRIDIYFYNGKDSNIPTDSNENNLINNAHLYSDEDIAKLCMALSNLFLNGTFVHPFISQQPIQENNNNNKYTNKTVMKINETQLRKIIKESVQSILRENHEEYSPVWDMIEDMKQYISVEDILARLISKIGPDAAVRYLQDIKSVEIDPYI